MSTGQVYRILSVSDDIHNRYNHLYYHSCSCIVGNENNGTQEKIRKETRGKRHTSKEGQSEKGERTV